MWALLYDDGTSLTTVSERIAHSLAEAELRRGRSVTVRRVDDVETPPRGAEEPARPSGDDPAGPGDTGEPVAPEPDTDTATVSADSEPEPEPEPVPELTAGPEPAQVSVEPTQTAEPASVPGSARRRRLLFYALAIASIVIAAALIDHSGVLPRVGANTSSSPTQVGGFPYGPQLLPPLDQPPVMHFSNALSNG